jgi:hypothetical protein
MGSQNCTNNHLSLPYLQDLKKHMDWLQQAFRYYKSSGQQGRQDSDMRLQGISSSAAIQGVSVVTFICFLQDSPLLHPKLPECPDLFLFPLVS